MKKLFGFVLVAFLCLSVTNNAYSQSKKEEQDKNLAVFPEAQQGMVRHVIFLDKKKDESKFKIEIMPGKTMSVDCNHHSLMGKLEERVVEGWGYTYYEFTSNGQTRSTMMACNKPNETKFVYGESKLTRYNSKLPIVIYVPVGFDVKYSIWQAGKEKPIPVK